MPRLSLPGRIVLVLMTALLAVIAAALTIERYERSAERMPPPVPYPRIEQAAGIIDFVRQLDPALRPALLRAVSGPQLRATIVDEAPPVTDDLRRAPRVEQILRDYAAPGLGVELEAYTNASIPPRRNSTEGLPTRIVWSMPDHRVLVLAGLDRQGRPPLTLLGLDPGLWIGFTGVVVAGFALLVAQREMRPLRRLIAAAAAFDGYSPVPTVAEEGAPDLRRLVRTFQEMQQRVTALLQERSFLIGAISHDLKTYLTRLRLRTETVADAEQRGRAIADLDAMTELIETSLAFARGTSVSQHRSLVDLADLVAIEAAERTASGQPVALSGEDAEDAIVLGDPLALRRVLANLVDNAVKFGRRRVEIRLDGDAAAYRVCIDDDGPGVTETERAAIFSPFYRIEGSRSRRTGGSGLGLAIARQIVHAHGGMISVTDGPIGGARFVVSLPKATRRKLAAWSGTQDARA